MGCPDCERIEQLPAGAGTLYLAPVLAHTRATLRQRMKDEQLPCSEPAGGILALPVMENGGLGEMLQRLEDVLS